MTVGCSTLIKQKCSSIKVIGRKKRFVIAGMSGEEIQSIVGFGTDEEDSMGTKSFFVRGLEGKNIRVSVVDPDEIVSFAVNSNVLNLISKACKITPNANVKIYMMEGKPVKLVFPVFLYGVIRVYLISK